MLPGVSRRSFGVAALAGGVTLAVEGCRPSAAAAAGSGGGVRKPAGPIELKKDFDPTEMESGKVVLPLAPGRRVGIAVVGLGRLALEEILPAIAQTRRCRLVAVVSGQREKATAVAAAHGIDERGVYDYASFDRIRNDPAIELVYIVLPNGMHLEFTKRAFEAGKHVLSEKPMAATVAEATAMLDASTKAKKMLMVAYRAQYEPHHRELIRMARANELGKLRGMIATNAQAQGDPSQWRMKKNLAGGGALPDIGIYCLNAARYLTGEEPSSVTAMIASDPSDPRFAEVEDQVSFTLRFPSGFLATCATSYSQHNSRLLRLSGSTGWAELDPAFAYEGLRMRIGKKDGTHETVTERRFPVKNQFALEMEHAAECVISGARPHTPGEEGLQDMKLMAAIYEAAASGSTVKLAPVPGVDPFRGPPPEEG